MSNLAGTSIEVTVGLKNPSNPNHILSFADYRIVDDQGGTLVDWTRLDGLAEGAESTVIVVPASANQLPSGVRVSAREIEVMVTTTDGYEYIVAKTYIVRGVVPELQIGENTLLNIAASDLFAIDTPGLSAWRAADREEKQACLKEAYRRITCLSFVIDGIRRNLSKMTRDEVLAIDAKILAAIKKAQIIEAANIMSGEQEDREDGVILETIGQVKKMFGKTKKLDLGLCKRAFSHVAPYVDISTRKVTRS